MVFLVMEKVPGVELDGFWDYDFEKRQKIRAAFRLAMLHVFLTHNWLSPLSFPLFSHVVLKVVSCVGSFGVTMQTSQIRVSRIFSMMRNRTNGT